MLRALPSRCILFRSALAYRISHSTIQSYHVSTPNLTTLEDYLLRGGNVMKMTSDDTYSSLLKFRRTIEKGDVLSIIESFGKVSGTSLVDILDGNDWKMISKCLRQHLDKPSQQVVEDVQEIAIYTAVKGYVDGLRSLMVFRLSQGDAKGVLSLYDRFYHSFPSFRKVEGKDEGANNDLDFGPDKLTLDLNDELPADFKALDIERPQDNQPHNVADLLIACIAAAALDNKWDMAFDLVMATPTWVRISRPAVQSFVSRYLEHSPSLMKKVTEWCQGLANCRLLSRVNSLSRYLSQMAMQMQIKSIEGLAWRIIDECRSPDGIFEVSEIMPINVNTTPRRLPISSLNSAPFIRAFGLCGDMASANRFWLALTSLGLIPNRQMWAALIDAYGRNKQPEKAEEIWGKMIEAGVEPNHYVYGILMNIYFRAGQPARAFGIFQQFCNYMESCQDKKGTLRDDSMIGIYNHVIHGLCRNRQSEKANEILHDILQNGPKPNIITYNIFLESYARQGDIQNVSAVLRSMTPAGLKPDAASFTTVLSFLQRIGVKDPHLKLLKIMDDMKISRDVIMYTAILKWLTESSEMDKIAEAIKLLHQMELDPKGNLQPTEVTYTALLAGIFSNPSISSSAARSYGLEVMQRMRQRSVYPNTVTYNYIMKACLRNPNTEGLQLCLEFYERMMKRGIKPSNRTWYVLLDGLYRRGEIGLATQMVQNMLESGAILDNPLIVLMEKIRKHGNISAFRIET